MKFKVSKSKKTWEERYSIFSESDLKKFGKEEGLSNEQNKVFAKFMRIRFPHERHSLYVQEWANRFASGHPESYMDSQSLEAYKTALVESGL